MSTVNMKPEDGLIGPPRTYTAQDRERDNSYRAGYLDGLEAAAKVCEGDSPLRQHRPIGIDAGGTAEFNAAAGYDAAQMDCAATIRALKE